MSTNNIQRLTKSQRLLLIIGVVVVIVGLFGGGILSCFIATKEVTSLSEVTKAGINSTVEVELVTDYFATLTTKFEQEKYYFITDKDTTYIAKLDDETFAKLKENYDYNYSSDPNGAPPDSITILGVSEEIPRDIKNFAIEYFQKSEGINLNSDNFSDIIYPYLINTYITKTDIIINNAIIFGVITVIGLILLMIYVDIKSKTKKSIACYNNFLSEIEDELSAKNSIHYKLLKTYLTKNYLVNYQYSLKIASLDDIIWIYPYEYRQSGIVINRKIVVITKNGQKSYIGNIKSWNKRKEDNYNDLYQQLLKRTLNALHGYSRDNKEEIKKLLDNCNK